jgi:hypothetical protein
VARFTELAETPGTLDKARSTRATHEAQLMPSMGRSQVLIGVADVAKVFMTVAPAE